MHGAQGILHFSLLRNNTASQIVLSLFIDFLEDRINNYGVYEIDRIGGRFEKRYNLGLAHGMPSIIISLARCINQGLDPNDKALALANKLCDVIMHFISANHLSLSLLPHVVSDENLFLDDKQENRNYTGRMGWCYGDLGIALSFYYMGKWTSNSEYLKISNLIFNHTLKRKELNVNYVQKKCKVVKTQ